MISQGSQLILQDLFQTIYLCCSCFKLFFKTQLSPLTCIHNVSSFWVQVFWTPFLPVLISTVCITQCVSLFSVFSYMFIYNLIPVNYSGFIWCRFFSFLVGVMCLICLFHLLNTYQLSFLKVSKEQDCEVLMAGISVHFGVLAFTGLVQFT